MPPSTRIKDDVAAELDLGPTFVPRDGACVRFEEAEHLLVGGNFLPLEDPAARLRNHLLHQGQYRLGLREEPLGFRLGLLAERRHHTGGLPHHMLGDLHELLVQLFLLRLFVFAFTPQLPMQLLCHSFG